MKLIHTTMTWALWASLAANACSSTDALLGGQDAGQGGATAVDDGSPAESAPSEAIDAPPAAIADGPSDADASDWQSCRGPGDCVLAVRGCCGGFYLPESYVAIQQDKAQAWRKSECPGPTFPACDASIVNNDRLLAFCVAGRCKVIDVPNDPISACSAPEDCVAISSRCDGSCGHPLSGPVAIRADQVATSAEQCGPALDARSFVCAPPDGGAAYRAECAADGHCKARLCPGGSVRPPVESCPSRPDAVEGAPCATMGGSCSLCSPNVSCCRQFLLCMQDAPGCMTWHQFEAGPCAPPAPADAAADRDGP